jgi:hypothetical protein
MTAAKPRPLGDENHHYWMALKMAKATGADLQAALDDGRISHGDWADLVQRCRGCEWVGGCACWMAAQTPGTAPVPQACPNAPAFERVLQGAEDTAGT